MSARTQSAPPDPSFPVLRVFDPPIPAAKAPSPGDIPRAFSEFDVAFQCATGWELTWQGPPGNSRDRSGRSTEHSWLRIADLSERLPPGVPAQSRIYCENLIAKLNRLIGEIAGAMNSGNAGTGRAPRASRMRQTVNILKRPCLHEQVSIVPLATRDRSSNGVPEPDGIQWHFRANGGVMVSFSDIAGPPELVTAGRFAAQTAFCSAARQLEDSGSIVEHVRATLHQTFGGELDAALMAWTLDPLLGLGSICGDPGFKFQLDDKPLVIRPDSSSGFVWLRGQRALVSGTREQPLEPHSMETWEKIARRCLACYAPRDWQQAVTEAVARSIPAVEAVPDLALAMIRH